MAAKALATQSTTLVPELTVRNSAVSLCLLLNRRAQTMRVIDFRAGPAKGKRSAVLSLARREGVEKVFTLVERDEVSTWVKLGFAREGSIPGFYKRSDAHLLGCLVRTARPLPAESEVRISVAGAIDEEFDPDAEPDVVDPSQQLAERTAQHARRYVKQLAERPLPAARVTALDEASARRAAAAAQRTGRALTGFEPFGRSVDRAFHLVASRGRGDLIASTESQTCFGNTLLELLTAPRSEAEVLTTIAGIATLCAQLLAQGVVSCFALAPSDDLGLTAAYVANGFRKSGVLRSQVVVGRARRDASLWTRKLAAPVDG